VGNRISREEKGSWEDNSLNVWNGSLLGSNGMVRMVDTVSSRHVRYVSGDDARNVDKGSVVREINKGKLWDDLSAKGWVNAALVGLG
jgi:hypothetical protein